MPAIDLSVLCIPAECDNIKLPIEYEIASRWDAYLLCDICRHFASVMLHFASLISLRLCSISLRSFRITFAAYLPTHIKSLRDFFQSLLNNHRDNLYIPSFFSRKNLVYRCLLVFLHRQFQPSLFAMLKQAGLFLYILYLAVNKQQMVSGSRMLKPRCAI